MDEKTPILTGNHFPRFSTFTTTSAAKAVLFLSLCHEITSRIVTFTYLLQFWHLYPAYFHGVWASWMESTTRRRIQQVWRLSRNRFHLCPCSLNAWESCHQTLRVRVQGLFENADTVSVFCNPTGIHDRCFFTCFSNNGQIMGD